MNHAQSVFVDLLLAYGGNDKTYALRRPIVEVFQKYAKENASTVLNDENVQKFLQSTYYAWWLRKISQDMPVHFLTRYNNSNLDTNETVFSKGTFYSTRREVIYLILYWFYTKCPEERYARQIEKEIFPEGSFENQFGAPVPEAEEEADKLLEAQKEIGKQRRAFSSGEVDVKQSDIGLTVGEKKQSKETTEELDGVVSSAHRFKPVIAKMQFGLQKPITALLALIVLVAVAYLILVRVDFFTASTPPVSTDSKPEVVAARDKIPGTTTLALALEHEKAGRESERQAALMQAANEGNPTAELELVFSDYRTGKGSEFEADFKEIAERHDIIPRAKAGDREARFFYGLMLMHGLTVEKDLSKAYSQLVSAANQGEIRAALSLSILILEQDDLGDKCNGFEKAKSAKANGYEIAKWIVARYLKGYLCPNEMGTKQKAIRDAISNLNSAIEANGHAESQNLLGVMYKEGVGFAKSDESDTEAFKLFEQAASQGILDATNNLGVMYANNRGVDSAEGKDQKAVDLFSKTAELNDARGQHSLGWMHMKGRVNNDKDPDTNAIRLFGLAVSQNYVKAKVDLAWMYRQGRGVERNAREAIRLYKEAARAGNNLAKINLGYMYLANEGVADNEKNKRIALDWFKNAAGESAEAQYKVGEMYLNRQGVPLSEDNDASAFKWFKKSADQGYPAAINGLGVLYAHGQGVEKNLDQALEYYLQASRLGSAVAKTNLGWLYASGVVVRQDYDKALQYFRDAEKTGDEAATAAIGYLYAYGYGVPEDHVEAARRFEKAATSGNAYAQFYLGQAYRLGWIGKNIDFKKAVNWYRNASDQGYQQAQVNLGLLFENGENVPRNDEEAVILYRAAADQGNLEGTTRLGRMYKYNRGVSESEDNDKTAVELFRKAADKGYDWAQYQLGLMYESDRGMRESPENDRLAVEWFQKASDQDYGYAQYELAQMYAEKRGVPTDVDTDAKALELFNEALPKTGGWELRTLARMNAWHYKNPDLAKLLRNTLELYIQEQNTEKLSDIFETDMWYAISEDIREPTQDKDGYHPCEAGATYWCFGYNKLELIEKLNRMSKIGMWEADLTLLFYHSEKGECAEANELLKSAISHAPSSASRFKTQLPEVLYGYGLDDVCKWEVDFVSIVKGVFEAIYDGYEDAYSLIDEEVADEYSDELLELYPNWIKKLEKKSLDDDISDWWLSFGRIYKEGRPGISKQPEVAEMWFRKAISAGETSASTQLAKLLITDFTPPRTSEAIESVIANYESEDAIGELERILSDVSSKSKRSSIAIEIKKVISDLQNATTTNDAE